MNRETYIQLRDELIRRDYAVDDEGAVRHIRNNNFNGNKLLGPLCFDDLENMADFAFDLMQKEVDDLLIVHLDREANAKKIFHQQAAIIDRLEKNLELMIGMAGNPDAILGCRNIITAAKGTTTEIKKLRDGE